MVTWEHIRGMIDDLEEEFRRRDALPQGEKDRLAAAGRRELGIRTVRLNGLWYFASPPEGQGFRITRVENRRIVEDRTVLFGDPLYAYLQGLFS